MKRFIPTIILLTVLLAACTTVNLDAPIPTFDTGIDPNAWAQIPAGEFSFGHHEDIVSTDAYQIMLTDVTTAQYADYLNQALAAGSVKLDGHRIVGYYPGDTFHAVKHEEHIDPAIGFLSPWTTRPSASPMTARPSLSSPGTKTTR